MLFVLVLLFVIIMNYCCWKFSYFGLFFSGWFYFHGFLRFNFVIISSIHTFFTDLFFTSLIRRLPFHILSDCSHQVSNSLRYLADLFYSLMGGWPVHVITVPWLFCGKFWRNFSQVSVMDFSLQIGPFVHPSYLSFRIFILFLAFPLAQSGFWFSYYGIAAVIHNTYTQVCPDFIPIVMNCVYFAVNFQGWSLFQNVEFFYIYLPLFFSFVLSCPCISSCSFW